MENEELFNRCDSNPIISAKDWPYRANSVFNPGATILQDGSTLLLCRVEDQTGISHLNAARSVNGIDGWQIDAAPTFPSDIKNHPEELWGVEDPRITFLPELKKYLITYTAYSSQGPCVSLATTEDFRQFERLGNVTPPDNKDAVVLPRRFNNRWAMIHRPLTNFGNHIWLSYSPDLIHWGSHTLIFESRGGGWWDSDRIGLGCPPIDTPQGWLMIYHGVRQTASGRIYRLGLALFDREDPTRCITRGNSWIFGPKAEYERGGDVPNVVFPCGFTIAPDGDTVNLYYGAADSSVALATGSIKTMLAWLEKNGGIPLNASIADINHPK
jgi:predicted GH43/DUF377 family glycosyl hydrolase